jgi:Mrp family chromosome partitioning ATPase/capsular polysaccharide biosynthesis protein
VAGVTTFDDPPVSARSTALTRTRVRWFVSCGLAFGLLGGAVAYAGTPLLPTTYTAQSQIVVRDPGDIDLFASRSGSNITPISLGAAEILRSPEVSIAASDLLDGQPSSAEIGSRLTVTTEPSSPVVTVDATAPTAEGAKDLADAVTQAYVRVERASYGSGAGRASRVLGQLLEDQQARLDEVQKELAAKVSAVRAAAPSFANPLDSVNYVQATLETDVDYQRLRNEATELSASINGTQDTIRQSDVNSLLLQSGVDRIIKAELPTTPTSPVLEKNVAAGVLAGILLGCAFAWRATERRRAVDPAAAGAMLGAPLLGSFGPDRRLRRFPRLADFAADSATGNELKVLTASLLLSARRRNSGAVVITSAHRGEGKSALACNIAAAGEYTGHSVVLVDAATGDDSVTDVVGLHESPGLSELLDGGPPSDSIELLTYGDGRTLPVMPIGREGWRNEAGRRLSGDRRTAWLAAFDGRDGRTAIVDAPAVNDHPLALLLAQGGTLVVVVSPRTTLTDLEVIRNRAEVADVAIAGFIMNEFSPGRRVPLRRLNRHGAYHGELTQFASERRQPVSS